MQIKLFTMPVFGGEAVEEELNKFLRSHRILQLERHFVAEQGGYWAMLAEYSGSDPTAEAPPQGRRERKDPSEGMTDAEKEQLHVRALVRYMDDTLLFSDDHDELMRQVRRYGEYVGDTLRLRLHEPVVNRTRFGIPFLGYGA